LFVHLLHKLLDARTKHKRGSTTHTARKNFLTALILFWKTTNAAVVKELFEKFTINNKKTNFAPNPLRVSERGCLLITCKRRLMGARAISARGKSTRAVSLIRVRAVKLRGLSTDS